MRGSQAACPPKHRPPSMTLRSQPEPKPTQGPDRTPQALPHLNFLKIRLWGERPRDEIQKGWTQKALDSLRWG